MKNSRRANDDDESLDRLRVVISRDEIVAWDRRTTVGAKEVVVSNWLPAAFSSSFSSRLINASPIRDALPRKGIDRGFAESIIYPSTYARVVARARKMCGLNRPNSPRRRNLSRAWPSFIRLPHRIPHPIVTLSLFLRCKSRPPSFLPLFFCLGAIATGFENRQRIINVRDSIEKLHSRFEM